MENSVALSNLLNRNMNYIVYLSQKVTNAVVEAQDTQQDLIERILVHVTKKDKEFFTMPIKEQDWGIRKVLYDFHIDMIRKYSCRPDMSQYHASVEGGGIRNYNSDEAIPFTPDSPAPMFNCSDFGDPEYNYQQNTMFEGLLERAKDYEDQYPGIMNFIQEAVFPSEETISQYHQYLDEKSNRPMDRHYIPPYRLVKILGISESRLRRYHIVISKLLSNLGVPKASEIHQRVSFT